MSGNRWFRMYGEFLTDPKVQMLSESDQRRFIMVMCMRSNGDVTLQDENVAFQLRISDDEWSSTKSRLVAKSLIGEDNMPTNWDKRQYVSDSSKERVSRHRAKLKQACNVTETPPDSDSDTERDIITTTEQVAPRGVKKVLKEALTRGVGGDVSVESRRRVAKTLGISDPGPIVEAYHRLRISRQAKQPDALFESQAPKIWQRASPEVRAACQPISAMDDAAVVVAKPSPYLVASLSARRHRHA